MFAERVFIRPHLDIRVLQVFSRAARVTPVEPGLSRRCLSQRIYQAGKQTLSVSSGRRVPAEQPDCRCALA